MTKTSDPILRMPRLKLLRYFIEHIGPRIDEAIADDDQAEVTRLTAVQQAWIEERDTLRRLMARRAFRMNRKAT